MEVNTLQKWNIAHNIISEYNKEKLLVDLKEVLASSKVEFVEKKILKYTNDISNSLLEKYKMAIIDFEGSPVFLCGLFIHDVILTFYIKNYQYKDSLYLTILEVIKKAKELTFFCFSEYEKTVLMEIYEYLVVQGYNLSAYNFIKSLPIINLQREKYESLTEAIYYLNFNSSTITGDSLFRNSRLIDKLFFAQKFEEIIVHNQNCLLNEYDLFLGRWLKNFTISGDV